MHQHDLGRSVVARCILQHQQSAVWCHVVERRASLEYIGTLEEPPRRPKKELPAEGIVVSSTTTPTEEAKPKKAGWWQRGFFGG